MTSLTSWVDDFTVDNFHNGTYDWSTSLGANANFTVGGGMLTPQESTVGGGSTDIWWYPASAPSWEGGRMEVSMTVYPNDALGWASNDPSKNEGGPSGMAIQIGFLNRGNGINPLSSDSWGVAGISQTLDPTTLLPAQLTQATGTGTVAEGLVLEYTGPGEVLQSNGSYTQVAGAWNVGNGWPNHPTTVLDSGFDLAAVKNTPLTCKLAWDGTSDTFEVSIGGVTWILPLPFPPTPVALGVGWLPFGQTWYPASEWSYSYGGIPTTVGARPGMSGAIKRPLIVQSPETAGLQATGLLG